MPFFLPDFLSVVRDKTLILALLASGGDFQPDRKHVDKSMIGFIVAMVYVFIDRILVEAVALVKFWLLLLLLLLFCSSVLVYFLFVCFLFCFIGKSCC